MVSRNLKNFALDHEILSQMEMPFILLGMELSLSKSVMSYVATVLSVLQATWLRMVFVFFAVPNFPLSNPQYSNNNDDDDVDDTYNITKPKKSGLIGLLELMQIFVYMCIFFWIENQKLSYFLDGPISQTRPQTTDCEYFGGRVHVSCSWVISSLLFLVLSLWKVHIKFLVKQHKVHLFMYPLYV